MSLFVQQFFSIDGHNAFLPPTVTLPFNPNDYIIDLLHYNFTASSYINNINSKITLFII